MLKKIFRLMGWAIFALFFVTLSALAQDKSVTQEKSKIIDVSAVVLPSSDSGSSLEPQEKKKEDAYQIDAKKEPAKSPIDVKADQMEYSQDTFIITAQGNVEIIKEDSVLTCDKATVNTKTNDVHSEGNVVFKSKDGFIRAKSFDYNFKSKTGQGYDAKIEYPPYFGRGAIVKKVSETEIEVKGGYLTTCDKEHPPHYRIQSRLAEIFPNDKVKTKAMTFRVGDVPILYMPKYTQNLKDDRMHVQVTPGKSKDWGLFLLTAWKYDLLPGVYGRIHLDYREKRDFAWGVDNYYDTKAVGMGYFKTYYMRERLLKRKRLYYLPHVPPPTEKERYRIQWRHKWNIDEASYLMAEYHKVRDTTFIKDYFFRESEKEKNAQYSSYILYSHNLLQAANFSVLTQKRTNRIFSETEKLPEIKLDKPSEKLFDSPLHLSSVSTYTNANQKNAAPSDVDESDQSLDNYNNFSLPFKLSFLDWNPHFGSRQTYFKRIAGRDVGIFREAWDSGIDVSTRFYRMFDFKGRVLGMEFNKLRHIISPSLGYAYVHPPTVSSSKLVLGGSLSETNQMDISLENKLQTKRKNITVDFLRLVINRDYKFNVEGFKRKWDDSSTLDLEMLPYDWLRFESDANYDHKKGYFPFANFDLKASGKGISWGGGYRYERKSSSQMTGEILLDLIKGWSFKVYERFQFKGNSLVKEQDYSISKELHCWILDINYNVLRERGETIWFALRLKAFPELAIDYSQMYHDPKSGSQGYPGGKSSD